MSAYIIFLPLRHEEQNDTGNPKLLNIQVIALNIPSLQPSERWTLLKDYLGFPAMTVCGSVKSTSGTSCFFKIMLYLLVAFLRRSLQE